MNTTENIRNDGLSYRRVLQKLQFFQESGDTQRIGNYINLLKEVENKPNLNEQEKVIFLQDRWSEWLLDFNMDAMSEIELLYLMSKQLSILIGRTTNSESNNLINECILNEVAELSAMLKRKKIKVESFGYVCEHIYLLSLKYGNAELKQLPNYNTVTSF